MKLKDIKPNPSNPRVIKDAKFDKLKQSIEEFPRMMSLRPMVLDESNVVLGGNMRLRALQALGYKDIDDSWVRKESDLTDKEKERFIIADNVGFGEWSWDDLANEWSNDELIDWGLDVWQAPEDVDYSVLDDDDMDDKLNDMEGGVKKAIQIEFEPEHYVEATEIVKYWRERDAYIGKMILDFLKAEMDK